MCNHIVYTYSECGHVSSDGVDRCTQAIATDRNCLRDTWGSVDGGSRQGNATPVSSLLLQTLTITTAATKVILEENLRGQNGNDSGEGEGFKAGLGRGEKE